MSLDAALLRRLEEEQTLLARQALTRPQGRDSFEYGRMAGMYGGLERARELLISLIDEDDDREAGL